MGVTLASSLVFSGVVPQNGLHITQVSAASEQNQEKRVIYVDGTKSDSGDGTSKASAVNSLEKAKELSADGAKILVCGTITVSEETTLRMPTQFKVSRADGFTGPILAITGKGKVTLTYAWLAESDVDTSKAELGKDAFVVGQKEEQKAEQSEVKDQNIKKEDTKEENSEKTDVKEETSKETESSNQKETDQTEKKKKTAPAVVLPGSLTMSEPGALNTLSLTENFSGDGTFRFAEPDKVMDTYQSQQQIIFTPNDTETYDYSGVEGWSEQGQEVVRYITVFVDSLKPQETQEEQKNSQEEIKDEQSQENTNETVTENPKENTVQEEKKETSEQVPGNSENASETTEQTPESSSASEEESSENTGEQPTQEAEDTVKEASGEVSNETSKEQTVMNSVQNQEESEPTQTEEKAPIGNLEDSATGIKVDGDFLPPYVDLRVSKITEDDVEEADIEAILKSYEITLWNLKTDEEYEVPEGKKVTVMIPVPEGAQLYESLIIAHYMEEKGEYEYFVAGQNLNIVDGYLVFETASFSPFNIGGNQLVGIGTKSPNHKPNVSYYSDVTAGSLTMVPAAGNTKTTAKADTTSDVSDTKKNKTDYSVKQGAVIASSEIGNTLNTNHSGQSDSSTALLERPTLLTTQSDTASTTQSTTVSTSASSNAKTGDHMNLFAWMGAATASFAVMVKADLTRKRRRKSRKYIK